MFGDDYKPDEAVKLINSGLPKRTQYSKLLQYQDRLPFWDESYYEQANPLTRSGVFSISQIKKHYDDYTPIRVVGEGNIFYRGYRLNTFDEDVFLQLLHYMRGQTLLRPIITTKKQLLSDLGYNDGGKNYKNLMKSLDRLDSAKLKISSPHALQKLYMLLTTPNLVKSCEPQFAEMLSKQFGDLKREIGEAMAKGDDYFLTIGFIQNNGGSMKSGRLMINIDPLNVLLYDGINTTRISKHERSMLCPAEKRLLGYVMSHSQLIYDLTLETYQQIVGSTSTSPRKFKSDLKRWLENLEKLGRIRAGWEITADNKVTGIKSVPY